MTRCVLCKSKDVRPLYTVHRSYGSFPIARCASCTLVFQDPLPKDIAAMYDAEYFAGEGFDETVNYSEQIHNPGWHGRFNDLRVKHLESLVDGRKILDVGCAFGLFLSSAKKRKWECFGVEISPHAAKGAKKHLGAKNVHVGTLDDCRFPKNSFDVITMFDVIEHVENPIKVIKQAYGLLKKGGVLCIETANVDSLVARLRKDKWGYFIPGHLFYFSRKTLRRALHEQKFSSIKIHHGDEINPLRKAWLFPAERRARVAIMGLARKIGVGDFSIGGMYAIARK